MMKAKKSKSIVTGSRTETEAATLTGRTTHSFEADVTDATSGVCGGKGPMIAALGALATIVVAAFVTLLLVLDGLQKDAADHASQVSIAGALDFSVSAVASIFEETRMLGLRLAKDRQTGTAPNCGNATIPLRTAIMSLASTMNASKVDVFAVYDTFQPADVPQAEHNLSYSLCAATSTVMQYMPSPPRVAEYTILSLPTVVGAFTGFFPGTAWNQTDARYVKHQMTMRPDAMAVGDWSLPEFFIHPSTKEATMYLSFHVPVAFDGPTAAPSASVSIDLLGTGFLPTLRKVQLERTEVILVDPRVDPLAISARTDLLLATTFATVPTLQNRSGSPAMWYADDTPEPKLNAAVATIRAAIAGGALRSISGLMQVEGPDDTILGAAPVVRPGKLKLVIITMTPHDVFDGNLKRGRRISYAVGASCAAVCLLALCALVLMTNSAARGLLGHLVGNSKRDTKNAPKDESKPFAVAFTDIQASTSLWARLPQVMGPALDVHHQVIRDCIAKCHGYEVKTIGDSFMVAFKDPADALTFAMRTQTALHEAEWGTDAFDAEYAELIATAYPEIALNLNLVSGARPGVLWNGLRVRVGVHYGQGTITEDTVTNGYDYYGTVVNTAARVEGVAHGGQVLITDALVSALPAEVLEAQHVLRLGPQPLRGLDDAVPLTQCLPKCFSQRVFPPLRLDVENHIDVDDEILMEVGLAATEFLSNAGSGQQEMVTMTSVEPTLPISRHSSVNSRTGAGVVSPGKTSARGTPKGGLVMMLPSTVGAPAGANPTNTKQSRYRLPSVVSDESSKDSTAEAVSMAVWRKQRVQMPYAKFALCCDTMRAVLGPLASKQRMQWVTQLAGKWRLQRTALATEDAAVASIVARASRAIDVADRIAAVGVGAEAEVCVSQEVSVAGSVGSGSAQPPSTPSVVSNRV